MVSIHRHLCVRQGKGAASGGQEGDEVPPRAANGQLEPLLPPLNTSFTHRKLPTESRRPVSCIHTQQNTQRGKKQMIACILSWAWTSIKFNNQASKCSIHGSKTETVMNHVDGIYKLKKIHFVGDFIYYWVGLSRRQKQLCMLKVCLVTSKWEVSEPQSDLSAVSLPGGCVLRSVCVCMYVYMCSCASE